MSAAAWPFSDVLPGRAPARDDAGRVSSRRKVVSKAAPNVATRVDVAHTANAMPRSQRDSDTADEDLMLRYAAGEVAGFGGGGMHGYRALEGSFLGGCLFSGRIAGRAAAAAV